jgi:hypothetical protein
MFLLMLPISETNEEPLSEWHSLNVTLDKNDGPAHWHPKKVIICSK